MRGTSTRTLFTRGSVYTAATAIRMAHGIILLPLVTRLFSASEYGEIALALVIGQIIAVIAGLGLPSAITRIHFDEVTVARRLLLSSLPIAVITTLIADLLGATWISVFAKIDYGATMRIAVWTAVPLVVVDASSQLFRAQGRPLHFVVVSTLSSVGARLFGVVLVLFWPGSTAAYMAGGLVLTCVAASYGLLLLVGRTDRLSSGSEVRPALKLGLPLAMHALALFAITTGDRVIIERQLGIVEVGRYQVAYVLGSMSIALLVAVNNAWAPMVFGADEASRWGFLDQTTRIVAILAGAVIAGIALVAPLVLRVLASPSYDVDSLVDTTAIVALAGLPYVVYLSHVHVLFQAKRTLPLSWTTPLAAVLNVLLNLWWIGPFGLDGAAAATVVAYLVQGLLVTWASRRIDERPKPPVRTAGGWTLALVGVVAGVTLPADALGIRLVGAAGVALFFIGYARQAMRHSETAIR